MNDGIVSETENITARTVCFSVVKDNKNFIWGMCWRYFLICTYRHGKIN